MVPRLDVTDREDYRAALAAFAEATDGKLDILFNNAGIGGGGLFADLPFETVMAVVNTNFIGVLIGIHEGVKYLRQTPGSMCFTTSSSSATFGIPGIATYSATKHAVKGLTEALSIEFKGLGDQGGRRPAGPDRHADPRPRHGGRGAQGGHCSAPFPPIEVAKIVWEAYGSDKLHWYVPPEIFEMDKAATLSPEHMRDSFLDGTWQSHLNAQADAAGVYPK